MRTKGLMEESVRATSIPIMVFFVLRYWLEIVKKDELGNGSLDILLYLLLDWFLPKKIQTNLWIQVANSMWKSAKQLQPGIHIIDSGQMQDLGK